MSRASDLAVTGLCWASALGTLAAVGVLLGFLLLRGGPTLDLHLLFGDAPAWLALSGRVPVWDGLWPALAGTLCVVVLSGALALPVGVGAGIQLSEFAREPWKGRVTFAIDLLAGVPSIVMGLFGFALILLLRGTLAPHANTSLLLSAACVALLILPYLVRGTQGALEGLPASLRLVGPSLGMTPWQNLIHVLLPAASRSLFGGVVLALGRAAEDTAVILMTGVVANAGMPRSLGDKFEALPFAIFYRAAEYRDSADLARGFGAALILLILTWGLLLGARALQVGLAGRWTVGGEP